MPVTFTEDGWFYAGRDGTCDESYEIKGNFEQRRKTRFTFADTDFNIEWAYLRKPVRENYELSKEKAVLTGTSVRIDYIGSPTFIAIRQRVFKGEVRVRVKISGGEAGITAYMCENEHYDIALKQTEDGVQAAAKLNIGGIKHTALSIPARNETVLKIVMNNYSYSLCAQTENGNVTLAAGESKYLSSEVSGGFRGVMLGLYAIGGTAEFTDFEYIIE